MQKQDESVGVTGESSELPQIDLQALLASSREAIARAAAEILDENEAQRMMATRHNSHSSYKSSSSW